MEQRRKLLVARVRDLTGFLRATCCSCTAPTEQRAQATLFLCARPSAALHGECLDEGDGLFMEYLQCFAAPSHR